MRGMREGKRRRGEKKERKGVHEAMLQEREGRAQEEMRGMR